MHMLTAVATAASSAAELDLVRRLKAADAPPQAGAVDRAAAAGVPGRRALRTAGRAVDRVGRARAPAQRDAGARAPGDRHTAGDLPDRAAAPRHRGAIDEGRGRAPRH